MRTVTVADSDFVLLGGGVRRGFLQVWRLTAQGGQLDEVRVAEHRAAVDSFTLDETDETSAYRITPRGVPGLSESWTVAVPAGSPISLSALIADHATNPALIVPPDPAIPSLLQTIRQIVADETYDRF